MKQNGRRKKGSEVDAAMKRSLTEDPGRFIWSAREWAEHLHCTSSLVTTTPTWQVTIRAKRLKATTKPGQAFDRRHAMSVRPKPAGPPLFQRARS